MSGIRLIQLGRASSAPSVAVGTAALRSAALAIHRAGEAATSPDNLNDGAWADLKFRGARASTLLDHCKASIFGQDQALRDLCLAIWATEAGLTPPSPRPLGVFLTFGPSGVGKTETAKQVAKYLFGGEPAILPLNEFGESDSSQKFKAALAAKIQADGHCRRVLLLDEIEKASRDSVDVLLSTFDEGRMLLPDGKYLTFGDYYIFVASNIGSDRLHSMDACDEASIETMRDFVFKEAARSLRPELFNRATRQVFYRPLSDRIQREIVRARLADKLAWMSQCLGNASIQIHNSAYDILIGLGFHDQRQGARRIRNIVEEMVDAAAAKACADPIPPTPPLELCARRDSGDELEFVSLAAGVTALPGVAFDPGPHGLPK